MSPTPSERERLRREAEEVLQMMEGFALMRENAQESDKKAFTEDYIRFRQA